MGLPNDGRGANAAHITVAAMDPSPESFVVEIARDWPVVVADGLVGALVAAAAALIVVRLQRRYDLRDRRLERAAAAAVDLSDAVATSTIAALEASNRPKAAGALRERARIVVAILQVATRTEPELSSFVEMTKLTEYSRELQNWSSLIGQLDFEIDEDGNAVYGGIDALLEGNRLIGHLGIASRAAVQMLGDFRRDVFGRHSRWHRVRTMWARRAEPRAVENG